jgi:hypothetical protein
MELFACALRVDAFCFVGLENEFASFVQLAVILVDRLIR